MSKSNGTVRGVRGVRPLHQEPQADMSDTAEAEGLFAYDLGRGIKANARLLGKELALGNSSLFRNGSDGLGLLHVLPDGQSRVILKASELSPIIIDSIDMVVMRNGKVVGELPSSGQLNAMLRSNEFLTNFVPIDELSTYPIYFEDFKLSSPGFHDRGHGQRVFYIGPTPKIGDTLVAINTFLDVMDFASNADRTNTVAAALTMILRNHFPGEKPLVLVTATKSHSGKGTITDFIRGGIPKVDLLYESIDWPMQSQFQRQIAANSEAGLILLDNVRLDSAGGRAKFIRSAFIESFVTNDEITLASPGAGEPIRLKNRFLLTINTNDGCLSPDLMNRALSIHLAPQGNIQDRLSVIGNPKLEFLPTHRDQIAAELRGMIERWKDAGQPVDDSVQHPMSPWAKSIGGILKVAGFADFLGNFRSRQTVSDPVREAIATLGAARPDQVLRPMEWGNIAVTEGLAKTLFSPAERDTEKGRERAIGRLLKPRLEETFEASTEDSRLLLKLEGGFRRWTAGENPHTAYAFRVLSREMEVAESSDGTTDEAQRFTSPQEATSDFDIPQMEQRTD